MKKVLVLGAGLVSRPLVHYLLERNFEVTVASRTESKAAALVKGFANGRALALNVSDSKALEQRVTGSDLVISLLPYVHHVAVANLCIAHRKHLITTSYVSPAMQALDAPARAAGVLLLNEIGLDPGIDHMSAMRIIHEIEHEGGTVSEFRSYCGGLPARQSNTNPFGYKFSWSPRGVIMAGNNNAQFLQNGQVVFIPARDLFKHYAIIHVDGVGDFEAYANRDSLPYREIYGLQDAITVFRGTLRNTGWCYTMQKARELGLLDDARRQDFGDISVRDLLARLIGRKNSMNIWEETARFLGIEPHSTVMQKFRWLGLFDHRPLPADPATGAPNSVMDVFCNLLLQKLSMQPEDRDMIVLHHQFIAKSAEGRTQYLSTLVEEGKSGGDSAMSRTVSLPAAIAARQILQDEIRTTGVQIPVIPEIYLPVLKELETFGITFIEKKLAPDVVDELSLN